MNDYYEFTGETLQHEGRTLHQIRAVKEVPHPAASWVVLPGSVGGWVESKDNLRGNAWVGNDAKVWGNAVVSEYARIGDSVCVYDNAKVYGYSYIMHMSCVYENAQVYGLATVWGESKIYGNARVHGDSYIIGKVSIFDDAEVRENAHLQGDAVVNGSTVIG